MRTTVIGAIAAAALASGIFIGWAGTTVARDVTVAATDCGSAMTDHMAGGGMGSMMSMMSMMSGSMTGPSASSMPMDPADHNSHHAMPSAEVTR